MNNKNYCLRGATAGLVLCVIMWAMYIVWKQDGFGFPALAHLAESLFTPIYFIVSFRWLAMIVLPITLIIAYWGLYQSFLSMFMFYIFPSMVLIGSGAIVGYIVGKNIRKNSQEV